MGMSAGAGKKGGRRRRGVPRYGAMAEINMTPFIDVMLVLLIIFMVAAPLLSSGVSIDLPETKAAALNIDQKPLSVAIDDTGAIFVMDQPVQIEELGARLAALAKAGKVFAQKITNFFFETPVRKALSMKPSSRSSGRTSAPRAWVHTRARALECRPSLHTCRHIAYIA